MLTQEQLAIRKLGISASEIAPVLGFSTFRNAIDVWRDKCGYASDDDENDAMRRGRLLEPAILQWYAEETESSIRFCGGEQRTFESKRHALVRATPDGIVFDGVGDDASPVHCVEAKNVCPYQTDNWGEPGTDEIPPAYIFQTQWQMAATGLLTRVDVPVFFGDRFALYRVQWNPRLFTAALARAEKWWDRYVVTNEPPPIDGSASCAAWMAERFPAIIPPPKEYVDAEPHRELIDSYAVARELAKRAATEQARLENEIKAIIGSAYGMRTHLGNIIWTHCKRGDTVDWRSVVDAMGGATKDQLDAYTKEGKPYRQFRAKLKGGESG